MDSVDRVAWLEDEGEGAASRISWVTGNFAGCAWGEGEDARTSAGSVDVIVTNVVCAFIDGVTAVRLEAMVYNV